MAKAKKSKEPRGFGVRLGFSVGLILLLVFAYIIRADGAYVIHIWPMWAWTPLILLPWVSLRFWHHWKGLLGCFAGWMLLLFALGEPSPTEFIPAGQEKPRAATLRVVSLNCAGGQLAAAEEVFALDPDIVLLQESPSEAALEELSQRRFGHGAIVRGPDASILSLRPPEEKQVEPNFVMAEVGGLRVASLRLQPPVLRFDLINPAAWSASRADIERRAAELAEIKQATGPLDLLGGDFNTPNAPRIAKLLPGMTEAERAMHGWGATAINDYPMVRIDQIWSSDRLVLVNAFVVKSEHSDHRISVADYAVAK